MSSKIFNPDDNYCLTCNKPRSRVPLVIDGKGFLVRSKFYGDWNYCHCPCKYIDQAFVLGTLPLHRGATTRRLIMKWEIKTELVVQEKSDKEKKPMIVKYSVMEVAGDDFDEACIAAKELCLAGENITSCSVILED